MPHSRPSETTTRCVAKRHPDYQPTQAKQLRGLVAAQSFGALPRLARVARLWIADTVRALKERYTVDRRHAQRALFFRHLSPSATEHKKHYRTLSAVSI